MSCTVEDELTAYLDGELSVVEAARVRTHLASCADCRATEALLRRTVTELAALPAFEPSSGLRRRVLAGVAAVTAVVVAVVAGQRVVAERAELRTELAVGEHYELLSDYEVVGLSRD